MRGKGHETKITVVRKRTTAKEKAPASGHRTETTVVAKGGAGKGQVEHVVIKE